MFTISKTTHKMAKSRGIDLIFSEGIGRDDADLLCFWELEEESEWLFSYQVSGHQLEWHGNIYASDCVLQDLPTVIPDERVLRQVICELAKKLTKPN